MKQKDNYVIQRSILSKGNKRKMVFPEVQSSQFCRDLHEHSFYGNFLRHHSDVSPRVNEERDFFGNFSMLSVNCLYKLATTSLCDKYSLCECSLGQRQLEQRFSRRETLQ